MIVHPPLYKTIQELLDTTFNEPVYASKAIEKNFRQNKKWGARDRKLIAETVYEMVRWKAKIAYTLGLKNIQNFTEQEIEKMMQFWFLLKQHRCAENQISLSDFNKFQKIWHQINKSQPEAFHSVPQWIIDMTSKEIGIEKTNKIFSSMNEPAKIYLRVNEIKSCIEDVKERLVVENDIQTEFIKKLPYGLALTDRKNVFRTDAFRKGWFEVQDGGSQQIVSLFDLKPQMRIIDACAGAGGKSLHLASLMKNKGKIIALDIHKWKLQQLKLRARRAGASIIESRLIVGTKTIKRLSDQADGLLLDVPCSGLGVLKRNPDTKWRLSPEELERLQSLQQKILHTYSKMVKKGGQMIYATCSILNSENKKQIEEFLNKNKNWELTKELHISPAEKTSKNFSFDGFYAAHLIRSY